MLLVQAVSDRTGNKQLLQIDAGAATGIRRIKGIIGVVGIHTTVTIQSHTVADLLRMLAGKTHLRHPEGFGVVTIERTIKTSTVTGNPAFTLRLKVGNAQIQLL